MTDTATSFLRNASDKVFDIAHRQKVNFNIARYDEAVKKGKDQFSDLATARKIAKNRKWKAIENLEYYLQNFEARFKENGGQVIWAQDHREAAEAIRKIVKRKKAERIVKSKSMVSEEIHLNDCLANDGYSVYETDLGEYIVQLAGEDPYHIVTPAMHKSKEDVAELFHDKLGTDENATPTELAGKTRQIMRDQFRHADVGITGANFVISDIGGIALTENEGNARLSFSTPSVHIALTGIEKVLPSMDDLATYWPLLSTFGTGQEVTNYNSIVTGPRQEGEPDGPDEMIVVLLDNGRTNLLAQPDQRESLYCIRCGACLNACPIYKNVGGHAYETTYSGPIGSVITPHLKGMKEYQHLSQASSLCGNCSEVCPVNINLHKLLLYNRRDSVQQKVRPRSEQFGFWLWKKGMLSRSLMNAGNSNMKNLVFQTLFSNSWGKNRAMLNFPEKSFNQMWRECKKN